MTYRPVPVPAQVPAKLTVTLWDFSWYTRTGPGEPFEDLDAAFEQAVARGYNTIRICAMPYLLFGSGLDTSEASFGPLGGEYAQGTRWYDVKHRVGLDARAHLLELFRAAQRHGVFVIVSSWEYQQSSSFYGDRSWFDALMAVDADKRAVVLADAHADLYEFLELHGVAEQVAFVELHNEVQLGRLTDGLAGEDHVLEMTERLTAGLDGFHERLPEVPVTVNYAHVPIASLRAVPQNIDVAVFHPYIYGVLDDLVVDFALRDEENFSTERVRPLLRQGAPDYADWLPPEQDRWRREANTIGKPEIYVHDWCNAEAWDRFLYERYAPHHLAMTGRLSDWIDVAGDFARTRGVPLVFAEGWLGYTPLEGNFEEGPIGAEYCRLAARKSREVSAWGYIVCSNAAPHHPMWQDQALQLECNRIFTTS